jgi:hypothetical protein
MKGPLPVKLLAGWLFHDGRYVEWGRIRTIEPDRILISGTVEDLPRPGTIELTSPPHRRRRPERGR